MGEAPARQNGGYRNTQRVTEGKRLDGVDLRYAYFTVPIHVDHQPMRFDFRWGWNTISSHACQLACPVHGSIENVTK